MTTLNAVFAVGQKIRFAEEKGAYTVRVLGPRFAILTKPFNPRRTVIYTIVDNQPLLQSGWRCFVGEWMLMRGPHNIIFNGYDFKTIEGCQRCLDDLESGEIELSVRRSIPVVLGEQS